jgi:hypothetical protein
MHNKFRIISLVIVILIFAGHAGEVVYAYGTPQEDFYLTTVRRTGCGNDVFRFNYEISGINPGPASRYILWQVVADTQSYTPTSKIWQAMARQQPINIAVPPPVLAGGYSTINDYVKNFWGGLQSDDPAPYPLAPTAPDTFIYIQVALIRYDYPYLIQSARVYPFLCTDAVGSAVRPPVFSCLGAACGGIGGGSALSPSAATSSLPFPLFPQ